MGAGDYCRRKKGLYYTDQHPVCAFLASRQGSTRCRARPAIPFVSAFFFLSERGTIIGIA